MNTSNLTKPSSLIRTTISNPEKVYRDNYKAKGLNKKFNKIRTSKNQSIINKMKHYIKTEHIHTKMK